MSLTNITEENNKRKNTVSEIQNLDESGTDQQSASSGVKAHLSIKVDVIPKESEHAAHSVSLSSLDELDLRLKNINLNTKNVYSTTKDYTNENSSTKSDIFNSSTQPTNTGTIKRKIEGSKSLDSLDELAERILRLETGEGTSGLNPHASVKVNIVHEYPKSLNTSVCSIEDELSFKQEPKLLEDDSFTTADACQKEKTTATEIPIATEITIATEIPIATENPIATEIPTAYNPSNRPPVVIVRSGNYRDQPPPPYEYQERTAYQRQPPDYQQYPYRSQYPQDADQAPPYRRSFNYMDVEDMFSSKVVRNSFIRKVYAILSVQLLFTFGLITFCIYEENTKEFVRTQWPLMIASMIAFFFLIIALSCYQNARRLFPLNFILLAALTLAMAYMTAAVSCYYDTYIVMATMGVTGVICTTISLLACQEWFDVTECGMALCLASVIVMIYGLLSIVVTILTGSNILYLIYSCAVTILFCMYLMYDTQQILGGRRIELSPNEYILGALTLYVDIMIIFQRLLVLSSLCR